LQCEVKRLALNGQSNRARVCPLLDQSRQSWIFDLPGLFWTKRCEKMSLEGAWVMPKKRFSAEQIVTLLRQIEVSMAQGNPTPVACRDAGISLQNYAMSC
jgi:hypothetical protein